MTPCARRAWARVRRRKIHNSYTKALGYASKVSSTPTGAHRLWLRLRCGRARHWLTSAIPPARYLALQLGDIDRRKDGVATQFPCGQTSSGRSSNITSCVMPAIVPSTTDWQLVRLQEASRHLPPGGAVPCARADCGPASARLAAARSWLSPIRRVLRQHLVHHARRPRLTVIRSCTVRHGTTTGPVARRRRASIQASSPTDAEDSSIRSSLALRSSVGSNARLGGRLLRGTVGQPPQPSRPSRRSPVSTAAQVKPRAPV